MSTASKLTVSTSEKPLLELFQTDSAFSIPFFQRPYSWTAKKISDFQEDLMGLYHGDGDELHFLGAVLYFKPPTLARASGRMEIIDGQQRLTTVFLHVLAIIKKLYSLGGDGIVAANVYGESYAVVKNPGLESHYRLRSASEDQDAMNVVMERVLKGHPDFGSWKKLDAVGTPARQSKVLKNFNAISKWLDGLSLTNVEDYDKLMDCLLGNMAIVEMQVSDPLIGPKIFASMNAKQEPMTVGDLIRNEIFRKNSDADPAVLLRLENDHWRPFYDSFKTEKYDARISFDKFLFPFGLCKKPNVPKRELFEFLFEQWDDNSPEEIIEDLAVYQGPFLAIFDGNFSAVNSEDIQNWLIRLRESGASSSIYPLVMNLLVEEVSEAEVCSVLEGVDTFLVRRAVCGEEPTGLHAVFKGLYSDLKDKNDFSAKAVLEIIDSKATVTLRRDAEVIESIKTRNLYKSRVTTYVLKEYDRSFSGDPASDDTIEHILPQKLTPEWESDWSEGDHEKCVGLLANLVLLSSKVNSSLGNESWDKKKARYIKSSSHASARHVATTYGSWDLAAFEDRQEEMIKWFMERWPNLLV